MNVERTICLHCGEYDDDCACGDAAAKLAKWEAYPQKFVCADCGFGVKIDEDGCCATCGRDCAIVAVIVEPEDMTPSMPDCANPECGHGKVAHLGGIESCRESGCSCEEYVP